MNNRIVTSLCVLCATLSAIQRASAQGSLTPPGAPAPTMLTLSQIEPRTPITSVPYTISTPGSYYLTTNLTVTTGSAITITTSWVTLDLNGFTVSSSAGSPNGTGILLAGGNTDITILNGHIQGTGFANGIYPAGCSNVRVAGVSVSGCLNYGIILGNANSTVVESCTVQNIGVTGIQASSVSHSSAYQCGGTAIIANTAENCYGNCSGSTVGLFAGIANNCYGYSFSGYGLYATTATGCYGFTVSGNAGLDANNANNCAGYSNGNGDGLDANNASGCSGYSIGGSGLAAAAIATGCSGVSTNSTGLSAITAINCTGQSSGSGVGLDAVTANNCQGQSAGGTGLQANNAETCSGQTSSGFYGLRVDTTANNCQGQCTGNGAGLVAVEIATGCYGYSASGTGLVAGKSATGCSGKSNGPNYGLISNEIAIGCYGYSSGSYGLVAPVAIGCVGSSMSTNHRYLTGIGPDS